MRFSLDVNEYKGTETPDFGAPAWERIIIMLDGRGKVLTQE